MPDQRINMVITAQDMASRQITAVRKNLMALGTGTGGALGGVLGGFGLMGAAGGPAFMAGVALGHLSDFLGNATQAAIEDEKSVARLTTALQANVEGFDGSTAAIDEYIEAGQLKAFTDDQQREAIGKLVIRTHDQVEAMNLTSLAMDLARGKGIDLASAAELVGKAYSGQVGALRRAGLAIDANATSTEALAAIQEAFGGQAEAFAETTEGSMQAMQISIDEAVEDIGRELMPAMKGLADTVRGDLLPALGEVGTKFNDLHRLLNPHVAEMQDLEDEYRHFASVAGLTAVQVEDGWAELTRRMSNDSERFRLEDLPAFVQSIQDAAIDMQREMAVATRGIPREIRQLAPEVRDAWQTGFLNPAMQVVKRAKHAIPAETTSMMDRVDDALNTGIPDLRDRWREIKKLWDPDWIRKQGREAERLIRQANRARERALATGNKEAVAVLDDFIADMSTRAALFDALDSTMTLNVNTKFGGNRPSRNQRLTQHRAGGGPVSPGQTYLVGEEGPELLVMGGQGGNVLPNGAGGPMTVVFAIDGQEFARKTFKYFDQEQGRRLALSSTATSFRG